MVPVNPAVAVKAELKRHGGVPTLYINDVPRPGVAYMSYWPKSRPLRDFAGAGVHLYSFPSTCCQHLWEHTVPTCWLNRDHFEYSHLDRQIEQVLAADPEALIFPRVYLMSPRWWDREHPDQLVTHDEGDGRPVPFYETNRTYDINQKRCPSWASEIWRADTAESLRHYIAHIQSSPYAAHVIGYHLASGTTEEWMYWGANDNAYADFSEPNRARFAEWLRRRYQDDTAALRQAWGDPDATFERVAVPTKAERLRTEALFFRDPQREGHVIDYFRYMSWLVADTICSFARVVAESTARQAFCGAFYGYTLQLCDRDQRWQNAGHLDLNQVLDSPDIDFLCSPSHYSARGLGRASYSVFMSLTDSIKLHDKSWFDENDYRTFLAKASGHGKTNTLADTIAVERRELANVLGNGVCMWWFDLYPEPWFSHPALMAEIARHRRIAEQSLDWDRRSASEVAVVVDEKTACYLQLASELPTHLIVRQLPELGRLGAPFALYLLDDLERLSGDEHKLWILLNAFAPTEAQRQLIRDRLQRAGHTLLWLYAPGFVRHERLSEEAMADLTGIRIRHELRELPLRVRAQVQTPSGAFEVYGSENPLGPVFYADDEAATVWGQLESVDKPGLVVKELAGWRSVYSAAPCLPAPLLRHIARSAGVHIYSERDDVIYANRQLLGVCVDEGGPRTIALPSTCDVYDLFAQRWVARQARSFELDLPANQTGLFYLGDERHFRP